LIYFDLVLIAFKWWRLSRPNVAYCSLAESGKNRCGCEEADCGDKFLKLTAGCCRARVASRVPGEWLGWRVDVLKKPVNLPNFSKLFEIVRNKAKF